MTSSKHWQVWNAWPTYLTVIINLVVGKLLVVFCLVCATIRLSCNSKPQHVVPLCIVPLTWPLKLVVIHQRKNSQNTYFASWGKIDTILLLWVTGKISECKRSGSWCFQIFRCRCSSKSLKDISRSGVGVWKMWLRSSL